MCNWLHVRAWLLAKLVQAMCESLLQLAVGRVCVVCAGPEATNALFNAIQNVIMRALLSVQPVMINDKHSFEVRQREEPGRMRGTVVPVHH